MAIELPRLFSPFPNSVHLLSLSNILSIQLSSSSGICSHISLMYSIFVLASGKPDQSTPSTDAANLLNPFPKSSRLSPKSPGLLLPIIQPSRPLSLGMRLQISIIFFAASHAGDTPDKSFPVTVSENVASPFARSPRLSPKTSASLLPIIRPSKPPVLGIRLHTSIILDAASQAGPTVSQLIPSVSVANVFMPSASLLKEPPKSLML